MSEERLIKKYPNRRLYDSEESCYITIADVRQFVVDEVPFKVVDNKKGDDITRSVLLQIIMEQESDGEPLFSIDVLSQFIRNSGAKSQEGFVTFLEQGLDLFKTQQTIATEQMNTAIGTNPLETWLEIGQKNIQILSDMQKDLLKK
jgi:polyhydroxyalkanoate synthesis repressor PhaR